MFPVEEFLGKIRGGESPQVLDALAQSEDKHKSDADPTVYWSSRLTRIQTLVLSMQADISGGQPTCRLSAPMLAGWDKKLRSVLAINPFPLVKQRPKISQVVASRFAHLAQRIRSEPYFYRVAWCLGCLIGLVLMPFHYFVFKPLIAPLFRMYSDRRRLAFLQRTLGECDEDMFGCMKALLLELPDNHVGYRIGIEKSIVQRVQIREAHRDFTWLATFCLESAQLAAQSSYGPADAQRLSAFVQRHSERLFRFIKDIEYTPTVIKLLRGVIAWQYVLLAKIRTMRVLDAIDAPQFDFSVSEEGVRHILNNIDILTHSFWSADRPMQLGLVQVVCLLLCVERDAQQIAQQLPEHPETPLFQCHVYGNLATLYAQFLACPKARSLCRHCVEIYRNNRSEFIRLFEEIQKEFPCDPDATYEALLFEKDAQSIFLMNPLELNDTSIRSKLTTLNHVANRGKTLLSKGLKAPDEFRGAILTTLIQVELTKIGLLRMQCLSLSGFQEVRQQIQSVRAFLDATPIPTKVFVTQRGEHKMELDGDTLVKYVDVYLALENMLVVAAEDTDCSLATQRRIVGLLRSLSTSSPLPAMRLYYEGLVNSYMAALYAREADSVGSSDSRHARTLYSRAIEMISASSWSDDIGRQSAIEALWRCKRDLLSVRDLIAKHKIQQAGSRLREVRTLLSAIPQRFRRLGELAQSEVMTQFEEESRLCLARADSLQGDIDSVDEGIWSHVGARFSGLLGMLAFAPSLIVLLPLAVQMGLSYIVYSQLGVVRVITVNLYDIPLLLLAVIRLILMYALTRYIALRKHGLGVGSVAKSIVAFLYYAMTPLFLYAVVRCAYHFIIFLRQGVIFRHG